MFRMKKLKHLRVLFLMFIYTEGNKFSNFHKAECNSDLFGPGHAKTCLMSYANNKGADKLGHPRSLIDIFVVRCLDSMICILAISKVEESC